MLEKPFFLRKSGKENREKPLWNGMWRTGGKKSGAL